MASPQRQSPPALRRLLISEGRTLAFFRAVQLLERIAPRSAVDVGKLGPVEREPARFVHDPSMGFPAGDISQIRDRPGLTGLSKLEITSSFLGLVGITSPLPTYFTEDAIDDELADGETRVLYDIVHHRIYSLLYRAWKKYRFYADARSDGSDGFTSRALAFVGVDAAAMPDRGLSAAHLLRLAPLLAVRTRSPRALRVLLEASLPGVPVKVEGFIPRIVVLDESQRPKLGAQNVSLGTDFTLGGRVLDRSGRFRTTLGPVPYETMEALMPGGRHFARLRQVMDQFTRGILEAEVDVVVDDSSAPGFRLGQERGGRLGVNTRLPGRRSGPLRMRFVLAEDASNLRTQLVEYDELPNSRGPMPSGQPPPPDATTSAG